MAKNHLQAIYDFYHHRRRMPSYSEILKLTGFKSKNAAYKLVRRLASDGKLNIDERGRLIPRFPLGAVPLLGTIEAGWPSPAEEELLDTMSLDEYLVGNRDATYLLKVRGDSMIDAGIREGDMVLVERGREPRDGDIVIAEVDREWTMKFFRRRAGKVWLEAGNKKYKPIEPSVELHISATVIAVIRKYK